MDMTANFANFGLRTDQSGQAAQAGKIKDEAQAREAAVSFEAMFLAAMLEHMGRDVQSGEGYFGAGQSEQVYSSLLNEQYGKDLSKNGGIGIADAVYRFILQAQEV